jgi:glycosyltransferase involved in cell wall biosynthesis
MARDSIALISTYIHPTQDSVERMLRAAFPEYHMEIVSILDIVKQHKGWIVPNLSCVAREYGANILQGVASLRTRYFQTTYLSRRIRTQMRNHLDPRRHVFSFQTQSQYDTAVPGVPHFIYTDHTHLSNLASPFFDRRLLRPPQWVALERALYHNAATVFTRSSDVTADLVQHYGLPPQQAVCVYAGNNACVPDDYTMDNAGYSNQNVLFLGGDWERKGGPQLVEAFREVQKAHPRAHLTIVGPNVSVDLPNCSVLGPLPLEELGAQFARASVFCVPTLLEPFGIVFVEAMLHRLPVVATRIGALPDMVMEGQTGHLVQPGDVQGLARALISLLGDPGRCHAFAEQGHRHATEKYTWKGVAERIRAAVLPLI